MYKQDSLGHQMSRVGALSEIASSMVGGTGRLGERLRQILLSIAEPFGAPLRIESLEPRVRSKLSASQKATTDAHLHGL
jgi:hypothetical protein